MARDLAAGLSRREALRRLGAGLGGALGCLYNGQPGCGGASGSASLTVTAPATLLQETAPSPETERTNRVNIVAGGPVTVGAERFHVAPAGAGNA